MLCDLRAFCVETNSAQIWIEENKLQREGMLQSSLSYRIYLRIATLSKLLGQ